MWDRIGQFFAPPTVSADREVAHTTLLLHTILWIIFVATLVGTGIMILVEPAEALIDLGMGVVLTLALVGLRLALLRGHVRPIAWLLTLLLWVTITYLTMTSGGIRGMIALAYCLVVVAAGALLGANATLVIGALCILSGALLFLLERLGLIAGSGEQPVPAESVVVFSLVITLIAALLQTSLQQRQRWSQLMRRSERMLAERNRDLQLNREAQSAYVRNVERRFAYLEATVRVTWETASALELTPLWERLVDLICDEFSLYHAAILLLDDTRRHLTLQAASGEAGRRWLARGYHLELPGSPDLEAVVWRGETRMCRAEDTMPSVSTGANFFNNPDLPDARTLLWLPLRQVQNSEVFGVLGLYSQDTDAFDTQDTLVLQSLADQSAMVINQARLFAELRESLQIAERVAGRATRESWQHWLRSEMGREYRYTGETAPEASLELAERLLPLRVRGQVLGQIIAHKAGRTWTAEENMILETLMAQLEQALDSARLYEVTQRRALREQLTREITDNIRASLTVEEAMRRAVQEVARVLRADETVGRIGAARTLTPPEGGA